jgi:23S rRNA pseudouridine1911/1915/1917 synthase
MDNMMELIADNYEKQNIKDYLEKHCSLSSRRVKKLLKEKKISINGKTAYFDNYVSKGDKITLDLIDTGKDSIVPENIPIDIIYEDEYLLATNKPAGMLVHPTKNHASGTLSNGIKHYFLEKGLNIPVRLVNRIDRDTSGIVVAAKSGEAHAALAAQLEKESSEKLYIAIVEGIVNSAKGIINKPIGVDEENPIRKAVRADGQPSITEYEVLEQFSKAACLRLKLITGRTHQIRVHLSSLGHSIFGDMLYGGNMNFIQRQALHAERLKFVHPFTEAVVELKACMPKDMQELISILKQKDMSS